MRPGEAAVDPATGRATGARRLARRDALRLAVAALAGLALVQPLADRALAQDGPAEDAPSDPDSLPVTLPPDDASEGDEAPAPAVVQDPWGVRPISLAIPALGVEAEVAPVAYDRDGLMDVPPHPDLVAWFQYGAGMGVPGNAIFAGHVDWDGRPRVFARLSALQPGDAVLVVDERGRGFQYVVESTQVYDAEAAPVEAIFAQNDEVPIVTLITCGGRYNAAAREYLDRVVVVAKGA
jgi:hypothetical protein